MAFCAVLVVVILAFLVALVVVVVVAMLVVVFVVVAAVVVVVLVVVAMAALSPTFDPGAASDLDRISGQGDGAKPIFWLSRSNATAWFIMNDAPRVSGGSP